MNSSAPVGKSEKVALALSLVIITIYRLLHFEAWALPGGDYYQYRRLAEAMGAGQLPTDGSIERPPALPVLMALLKSFAPGEDPYIHVATALSFVAGLLIIVFLWTIARAYLPAPAALLVVWLYSYNNEVSSASLAPYTDALCACFVLLTFVLDGKRSLWAYLPAGIAPLFRYQTGLLPFALFVRDMVVGPQRVKRALLAGIAVAPTFLWLLLATVTNSEDRVPYGGVAMVSQGFQPVFIKTLAAATLEILPRSFGEAVKGGDNLAMVAGIAGFAAVLLIGLLGLSILWRRDRNRTGAMLLFAGILVAFHLRVPWGPQRYALPILWIVYLAFVAGLCRIVGQYREPDGTWVVNPRRLLSVGGVLALALLVLWVVWRPVYAMSGWSIAFAIPLIALTLLPFSDCRFSTQGGLRYATTMVMLTVCVLLGASTYDYTAYAMARNEAYYAEVHPAGMWYRSAAEPGDRMLVEFPVHSPLTTPPIGVEKEMLVSSGELPDGTPEEALDAVGANYVLWTSSSFDNPMRGVAASDARNEHRWQACHLDVFEAARGGLPGWEEYRRFEHRGKTAIVYRRMSPEPPLNPPSPHP